MGVASHEHVKRGIAGGFAQVCHGKNASLKRMHKDDWIIYYSPTEHFGQKEPCRKFTAIGKIISDEPYQFEMSKDFIPWRVDVEFLPLPPCEIVPLIPELSFIKNKKHWGFVFRRGCFAIPKHDFQLIANAMKAQTS